MIKKFTVTLPSKSSYEHKKVKVEYDKDLDDYLVTLPPSSLVFLASDLIEIAHQIDEVRSQNYKYKR